MKLGMKHNQHGFTVHEMLLVILISVVLLALSVVGILTYMRYLQLAQLDNSAKEIFLAAQNRAILLRSNQQLDGLVVDGTNSIENVEVIPGSAGGIQITVYYIHYDSTNIGQLLPDGTIDPTLWDGDFWITYEPESGSVIDVFFCDQELGVTKDSFTAFYEKWRAASKLDRMNHKPMIGYYGGESAQSGNTISLRTPVINIYNEDTLWVEITYWVPRTLLTMGEADKVDLSVSLTYQGNEIDISPDSHLTPSSTDDPAYLTYTYTRILDSLKEDEPQFQDLFPEPTYALTYGDDFTISAEVSYSGNAIKVNGALKRATDNSLFAKSSTGDTADITCLRHLQNLDKEWSKVSDTKTKAVQKADIQGVEDYLFKPIENKALTSYDGKDPSGHDDKVYSIYDLQIESSGNAPAGMFGSFGEAGTRKTLTNIRLVNTIVNGSSGPAGGLVGSGSNLDIENCQVYWENRSEETTNLREVLGDSDKGIQYQITGSGLAGGLAGILTNSTLTDCSASSLLQSTGPVGGLVGQGSGLTIDRSYAASYLSGPAAAGLVGDLTGNSTTIFGSYAVGFIDSGSTVGAEAAGLCLGSGTAAVTSAYSAMLFTAADTVTNYPLCKTGNDYKNTHYLDAEQFHFQGNPDLGVSYGDLVNPGKWTELFGSDVFTSKRIAQSHPYNLQTTLSLNTYIYPGLANMDHWGDWGAQFQNGSLVYYEVYQEANGYSYGFHISGLSDDKTVVEDGYAVLYESTDQISSIGAVLSVTYQTANGEITEKFPYGDGGDDHPIYKAEVKDDTGTEEEISYYYLLPLPEEVVNSDHVAQDFYQKITINDIPQGDDIIPAGEQIYYYSPHFANTVLTDEEITEDELYEQAEQLRVEVRTPRHLYNLSRFADYYASEHQYRFLQQRDLDYGTYTGYKRFTNLFTGIWSQAPIGLSANSPFRCVYYGNYHSITGVAPAVKDADGNTYQYIGLFGYSTGVLQNIVYQMQEDKTISVTQSGSSSQTLYVGALAGFNRGTVDNCAAYEVHLKANGYQYSTIYLGGLVGRNDGTIQNSAVEGASITAEASMSHAYAGGFVGENTAGGIIDQCYAVGKVSVSQARYGTVYACGFAGRSSASLSRSYAAVYLLSDGDAQRYGFCPDSSRSCVYLNNGNFTYRDENYAALYEDPSATPVTWEALAGQADGTASEEMANQVAAVQALGMGSNASSTWGKNYPYPATVTTKDGGYIHYGQWPEQMDLGAMGVYYWEKLIIGETSSYHISAISMTADNKVMKSGTLSTAHGDGGVVTEYGYGYFSQVDASGAIMDTKLTSAGIGFSNDANFTPNKDLENVDANDALSKLMGGKYTFHSYNTWGTEKNDEGLYTSAAGVNGQPPYGTWWLEQGAYSLTVQLNPFFADAMSCKDTAQGSTALTSLPGTSDNPYEVRSIDQLQFINWNSDAKNTIRRMDKWNMHYFPYLCYGTNGNWIERKFHWEQTHDLQGEANTTYTPIAGVYDPDFTTQSGGNLFGWFGGTYNGNDYLIAEVSIAPISSGQYNETSCVGLFGAVYNGTLENIVLYSETGSATVTGNNSGTSQWYVIGALAGLAGSSTGSAVVNCTVAGYTIQDQHWSTSSEGWGGTGVGGLIGICDMDLVGCTAVTDIIVSSKNSDNVRIGGLVGSCQGSISSSYTGGSIQIDKSTWVPADERFYHIYVGGIVGGIYMKPLQVGGSGTFKVGRDGQELQNTLSNCYTYMELPAAGSHSKIRGLYAVGGSGELDETGGNFANHGKTIYNNNYYLESVVLKNNEGKFPTWNPTGNRTLKTDSGNVTPMTYADMADTDPNSKDGLLKKLNDNIINKDDKFSTVTTVSSGGNPLNGRYSFGSDLSLLGKDYPFPTILTQSSSLVASGKANVHYGNWPLAGIKRENGGLPVNLDLFANYNKDLKGAVHTETLSLEGVDTDGTWSVTIDDDSIATPELSKTTGETNTLSITGKQTGSTVVTITYTTKDNTKYTLDIAVNVTAELRLAAKTSPVLAFTSQTAQQPAGVQTSLELLNRDNKPLAEELRIQLENPIVEFDTDYLATASVDLTNLILTADNGVNPGNTQITVGYDYIYQGKTYHATSSIALNLVKPTIELTTLLVTFGQDQAASSKMLFTYKGAALNETTDQGTVAGGSFTLTLDGENAEKLDKLGIINFNPNDDQRDMIWVEWDKDEENKDIIGTLSIEAYCPKLGTNYAAVPLQFQFDYEGSTHTMWQTLPVEIKKESKDEGGSTEGGGEGTETEEVQP